MILRLITFPSGKFLGLAFVLASVSSHSGAQDVITNLTLSASHNDNVGLTNWEEDRISDNLIELDASRSYRNRIGTAASVTYGADFSIRDYQDYPCDRATLGVNIGYERKLGIGFDKPRVAISWNGSRSFYDASIRNGYDTELSLSISKPVHEQLDISLSLSKNWQIPDDSPDAYDIPSAYTELPSDALNQESVNLSLSAEYYATANWSFPFSINYSNGDIVSVAREWESTFASAEAVANDEAVGPDWFAYRSQGHAWSSSIAANRLLAGGSTIDFQLEYLNASIDGGAKYDRRTLKISWTKNW